MRRSATPLAVLQAHTNSTNFLKLEFEKTKYRAFYTPKEYIFGTLILDIYLLVTP